MVLQHAGYETLGAGRVGEGGVTTPLLKLQARSNHSAISKSD